MKITADIVFYGDIINNNKNILDLIEICFKSINENNNDLINSDIFIHIYKILHDDLFSIVKGVNI